MEQGLPRGCDRKIKMVDVTPIMYSGSVERLEFWNKVSRVFLVLFQMFDTDNESIIEIFLTGIGFHFYFYHLVSQV